jgi:acyl-CoA thioester hydrolase
VNGICHRYPREVAFSDTDASGWVHFTKLLGYAEEAEHGYLRECGIPVFDKASGGWPRVRIACDYRLPLRFQDRIEVRLMLGKIGGSSVEWKFEIANAGGDIVAEGEMVTVKVNAIGKAEPISAAEKKLLEGVA